MWTALEIFPGVYVVAPGWERREGLYMGNRFIPKKYYRNKKPLCIPSDVLPQGRNSKAEDPKTA